MPPEAYGLIGGLAGFLVAFGVYRYSFLERRVRRLEAQFYRKAKGNFEVIDSRVIGDAVPRDLYKEHGLERLVRP